MIRNRWLLASVLAAASLILVACSDDDPTDPGNPGSPPAFAPTDFATVELPENLVASTAPEAEFIADVRLAMTLQLQTMLEAFGAPSDTAVAEKGGSWTSTWTWTEGEDVVAVELVTADTGPSYTWVMTVSGTIAGETRTDFRFYEASARKNGSQGYVRVADPGLASGDWDLVWDWETSDGAFLMTVTSTLPGDEGRVTFRIESDGSGSILVEERDGDAWARDLLYTWTPGGSGGTYIEYADGDPVDTGDWGEDDPIDVTPPDAPVVTLAMEGLWEFEAVETDCVTGAVVGTQSGTDVLCAGTPFFADGADLSGCELTWYDDGDFHVLCEDSETAAGCESSFREETRVTYTSSTMTQTYRLEMAAVGAGCDFTYDDCYEVTITATRIGDASPGDCAGKAVSPLMRWTTGRPPRP